MLDKCFNVDFVFDMGFDRRFNSLQNLLIENCPHPDDIDDSLVDDYSLLYQADTEMESISCLHLNDIGDSMLDDYILLHEVDTVESISCPLWRGSAWENHGGNQPSERRTSLSCIWKAFNTTTALHGNGLFFKVEYTFVLLYGATQTLSRVIIETCEAGRV